jgi:four helix bundle protein
MDALENLEVWKRACRLSVSLYKSLSNCQEYSYRDQLTRSGLSVASNIAEGYERDSHRSYVQFLKIAKGSCGELWTQLLIGRQAGLIDAIDSREYEKEAKEISKMLYGLIKHYQKIQSPKP